jgi:hypothetical protein
MVVVSDLDHEGPHVCQESHSDGRSAVRYMNNTLRFGILRNQDMPLNLHGENAS